MPANKDQHFVPKFLMRNFSSDQSPESEKKWINLYLLEKRKFIPKVSIAGQCQRAYFYGKDLKIEKIIGLIESRAKDLIMCLLSEKINQLSDNELSDIKNFIHIQNMRTLQASKRTDLFFDAMMKFGLERDVNLEDIDLSRITLHHSNPQVINLMAACESLPFLDDLEIRIMRNTNSTNFFLSDHPVCTYNQFAENDHWLSERYSSACGVASKGIQLFMPLSPYFCAAMYDPSTYDYGKKRVIDINSEDSWKINILHASNADSCLYVKDDFPDIKILNALAIRNKKAKLKRNVNIRKGPVVDEPNGRKSQMSAFNMPDIRLGIKFSFARIINKISYEGYNLGAFPPRSFKQVEQVRLFREQLKSSSLQAVKNNIVDS